MQGENRKQLEAMLEAAGPDLVGARVRRIRERQGLSLRELAEKAQLSKNTLLRLEQGFPSRVSTLRQVARALGVKGVVLCSLDYEESPVISFQKLEDMRWHDMDNYRGKKFPLVEGEMSREERVEMGMRGITPFANLSSGVEGDFFHPNMIELFGSTPRRSHPGMEFCFIVDGEIDVVFESLKVRMVAGESMSFHSTEVHHYEAVGEVRPARILSIIVHFGENVKGKPSNWGWVQRQSLDLG